MLQNVALEYRWAESELARIPVFAAELVDRRVTVIVTVGGGVLQMVNSISTIPIVFVFRGDLAEAGLVTGLNRPTGNATDVNLRQFLAGAESA